MGKCFSRPKTTGPKKVTIALFGLDNAGKSSVVKVLQGESQKEVAPTVGFSTNQLNWKRIGVTMLDVGGGERIRNIWKNYYAESHGLVYVVDASDAERVREAADQFAQLLNDNRIQSKPVLLLLNKQDLAGAIDETQAADQMKLEPLVNSNKCPCRVEMVSATRGTGKRMDAALDEGFTWLINYIELHYDDLSEKVNRDMELQRAQLAKEKEDRLERIRKANEEDELGENGNTNAEKPNTEEQQAHKAEPNGSIDYARQRRASDHVIAVPVQNAVNGHLPASIHEPGHRWQRRVRPLSAGHGATASTLTSSFQNSVNSYLPPIVSPPDRRKSPRLPTSDDIPPPISPPPMTFEPLPADLVGAVGLQSPMAVVPTFPPPPTFIDPTIMDREQSPKRNPEEKYELKERGARRKRRKRRLQRFNRTAPSNDTDLPNVTSELVPSVKTDGTEYREKLENRRVSQTIARDLYSLSTVATGEAGSAEKYAL